VAVTESDGLLHWGYAARQTGSPDNAAAVASRILESTTRRIEEELITRDK
jgi:hypothetical protein